MKNVIIYLEVRVVDPAQPNQYAAVWRRTLFDCPSVAPGLKFMLYTKNREQRWLFPSGGDSMGEHYDTHLDALVVWVQFSQPLDFTAFGFTPLSPERWL